MEMGEIIIKITEAYRTIADQPGAWVKLADLRDQVGESINRHAMDQALIRMSRRPEVAIVPESVQRSLTPMDRECAVVIGAQARHLISID